MPAGAPAAFTEAVEQLRHARLRPEVRLVEVPAPQRIAPHSVALSAEVDGLEGPDGPEVASGRFVLLHDPAGQEAWQGTMRVVTYVRAALEPELASDPVLSDVGWSWLTDCLEAAGADAGALGGTVTRVLSDCHGTLAERPPTVELEIRASWTADDPDGADPTAASRRTCRAGRRCSAPSRDCRRCPRASAPCGAACADHRAAPGAPSSCLVAAVRSRWSGRSTSSALQSVGTWADRGMQEVVEPRRGGMG